MDVHSNAAVSSNLVEDFLPCENMEGGGVSLEWLSNFVEECLNGQGFTTQLPFSTTPIPTPTATHQTPNPTQLPPKDLSISTSTSIPSKARTKRRKTNNFQVMNVNMNADSSDPTLLPQAYWLADSELLNFPKKQQQQQQQQDEEEPPQLKLKVKLEEKEEEEEEEGEEGKMVHPRRCTHCGSYKTPQWRAGPLGPKTLCNACGVRFKSGRLLPEYRPAKSPTFESFKHSNSHKKVMEMRMATLLSSHSN